MPSRWILFLVTTLPLAAMGDTPLILVSLDAFRWDYCELHPVETPNLRRLKAMGVSARGLVPVFPSHTFPNHYSIVTGLRPLHHGIVNNDFFDNESGRFFHSSLPVSVRDPRWWHGEPIWVTAIKQGRNAATSFWVGSETEIEGVRPTYWRYYDYRIPFDKRLEELINWLNLPQKQRPAFVAFYFEEANSAGHAFGPDAPELVAAIKLLDLQIGEMVEALKRQGIEFNLVVVSDHGMTEISPDRVIFLEDYLDGATVQIQFEGSVTGLAPLRGSVGELVDALSSAPHVAVYRVEDMPTRFRVQRSPLLPPVWVLPEEGWHFISRAGFTKQSQRYPGTKYLRGEHGYDPALPSMHGIFIASGPAFRRGIEIPEIENIHIYNLLCATLGLTPSDNDGDERLVNAVLRPTSP